jgi:hypothetical protein
LAGVEAARRLELREPLEERFAAPTHRARLDEPPCRRALRYAAVFAHRGRPTAHVSGRLGRRVRGGLRASPRVRRGCAARVAREPLSLRGGAHFAQRPRFGLGLRVGRLQRALLQRQAQRARSLLFGR